MTQEDYPAFKLLMATWGEVCVGKEEDKRPSPEKVYFYFNKFRNYSLEEMRVRGEKHFDNNKWFPAPSELLNQYDESQALEAYSLIEELMYNFYDPMLGTCCLNAMNEKLDNMGKGYLKPVLMKWGTEIYSRQNPTATRAQFLKSFPIETKGIDINRQLGMGTKKPKMLVEDLSITEEEIERKIRTVKERNRNIKQLKSHEKNVFEEGLRKLEEIRQELHQNSQ